ncbi:MAG: hypothetical protein ACQETV_05295 [Actinomycetota bacterium]
MSSIETLRGVLVAGAVAAAVLAALLGLWLPAAVLAVGVLIHGVLTPYVRRQARPASPSAGDVPPRPLAE